MKRRSGFSLIEVLTYIAVLSVVSIVAYSAYHRFHRGSSDLRRSADDIVRVMRAGERWRQDIRSATGPITWIDSSGIVVPQRKGSVIYSFDSGKLTRTSEPQLPVMLIPNMKSSTMRTEKRNHVTVWLWELELASARKDTRVRPLFSFIAVPEAHP